MLPLAGRVALFLSAEVAHEVAPAFAERHAVTLWCAGGAGRATGPYARVHGARTVRAQSSYGRVSASCGAGLSSGLTL